MGEIRESIVTEDGGFWYDVPKNPARILIDDLEEKMTIIFGVEGGRYLYKIEPYPESHHVT